MTDSVPADGQVAHGRTDGVGVYLGPVEPPTESRPTNDEQQQPASPDDSAQISPTEAER